MTRSRRTSRTVTVRGALLSELLGDPGPEGPVPGWQIEPPGAGPVSSCPVCGRRVAAHALEHHLQCYDPDANCTVADVRVWFRIDAR